MNKTLEIIAKRSTCRSYQSTPIAREDLEKIAAAGNQSPSSMNRQPWQIIVVTNSDLLQDLEDAGIKTLEADSQYAKFLESIKTRGGKLFYNAPCMIFVTKNASSSPEDLDSSSRDVGIVVENLTLAATALGYGSCICGLARLPLESKQGDELKSRIGFPEGHDFGIALLVGAPTDGAIKNQHEFDPNKVTWVV